MRVRIKQSTHAEIGTGDEGELLGITVALTKKFTVSGVVQTAQEQTRNYTFPLEDVEFLDGAQPAVVVAPESALARVVPPDTRPSMAHKFDIGGYKGFLHVGFADEAKTKPIEIFVTWSRSGSTLGGVTACFARAVSMLLQYGVPLEVVVRKFEWHRFEPSGPVKDPRIKNCVSVVDYLARWLGYNYVPDYKPTDPK